MFRARTPLDLRYERERESDMAEIERRMGRAACFAPTEGDTAANNYAVGSYLVHQGTLYKVTSAIASGESIVPGTNVTATTVMAELAAINA